MHLFTNDYTGKDREDLLQFAIRLRLSLFLAHTDTADDAVGHKPCDGDKYPAGSPCLFTKQHSQADIENGSTANGDIIQPGKAFSMLFFYDMSRYQQAVHMCP